MGLGRGQAVAEAGGYGALFSQALAGQLDAIGVMDESIEDGVGDGGIADDFVPAVDGDLTGDDGRSALKSVLHDLEKIAPLVVAELIGPPVLQDEKIGPGEGFEQSGVSAITPCQGDGGEQPQDADAIVRRHHWRSRG